MTALHQTCGELESQAFGSAHLTEGAFGEQDPHSSCRSSARGLPRVLGGGLFESDELRPLLLAAAYVRPVEIRRCGGRTLRRAEELHLRFGERAPALLVIAVAARRDDVLPGVLPAAVAWHHVVERQVVPPLAAVLAGVVVALEHFLARQLHDRARPLHVIGEADDRGGWETEPLAGHDVAVLFDDGRLLLREQDDSAPDVAHVQRLEVEVQDQDIRVDDRHAPILGCARYDEAGMTPSQNGSNGTGKTGTWTLKTGLAQMLKGGVIMDVVTAEHAKIAEDAGAVAVMALERVPADIRATGGVARMSDPEKILEIMEAVTIPVMAKCRIGHFVEARVLEALGVDYIDESEVLTPADEQFHVGKHDFKVPFVCGARDLGEALRRINEGAAMIRSKGEAGTGNVVEAVRHLRAITSQIKALVDLDESGLAEKAREYRVPLELIKRVAKDQRLPVVLFCAGGIATPADAALMMQLGAEGNFVGSGIFKSGDPARRAKAIVEATTHYTDAKLIAEVSRGLGEPMRGISLETIPAAERLAVRGW